MQRTILLLGMPMLAAALPVLAACGSSGNSTSLSTAAASTPSTPMATSLPPTVAPVQGDMSAEQLRTLIFASASTVKDVRYDEHSTLDIPVWERAHVETGSITMTTLSGALFSPPAKPTDKIDMLKTGGKTYYRVSGGPWIHDADSDVTPPSPSPQDRFPIWLQVVSYTVGHQDTYSSEQGTVSGTLTDLSAAPAPSSGSNRCWTLTSTIVGTTVLPGSPARGWTTQHIFTACEPDFLVTALTMHNVPASPIVVDTVYDNFRYNTGEVPTAPTEAVEVHCKAYTRESQEWRTCILNK